MNILSKTSAMKTTVGSVAEDYISVFQPIYFQSESVRRSMLDILERSDYATVEVKGSHIKAAA